MKKLSFLLVMAVLMVALMTGSAFATRYDSTYATFSGSPHGQYSTATTKCAACHAVHNPGQLATSTVTVDKESLDHATRQTAMGSSEVLLRGTIANACTYCHISGPFAIKKVYGANAANYTTASGFGHTSNGAAMSDAGVNCVDCHQVHGASALMASTTDLYMYRKILKSQPAYDSDAPAFVANPSTTVVNDTNMSKWCSGCHGYYETGHNQNSHIMASANNNFKTGPGGNAAANFDGKVAWAASSYCRSCHQNGNTNQLAATNGANNFPHFTNGYRFLNQANSFTDTAGDAVAPATAGQPANDGTCLICHANGTLNQGAGLTF